jgi:hypothetical protein
VTGRLSALAAVVLISGCGSGSDAGVGSTYVEEPIAELTLGLTIGDDPAAAPEDQFAEIASIYLADDLTLWVADGTTVGFGSGSPVVRMFDAEGTFVRLVGREGDGPGEFRRPYGFALLPDGRIAMRDMGGAERVVIYTEDGDAEATWSLRMAGVTGIYRGPDPIRIDTVGRIWLSAVGRPGPDRRSLYVRLRPDGTVLDTVAAPTLPEVERDELRIERTLPSGGRSIRGFAVPYQPWGLTAWHGSGRFAVAASDEYRIWWADDPAATVAERDVRPVGVSAPEREVARVRLIEEVRSVEGGESLDIPEIPRVKPPLKYIQFSEDARLLVLVSMPSALRDGEWTEPFAYDVFDLDGSFTARILLPEGFSMHGLRGDLLWGVARDSLGVQSIRRYRIAWP